MTLALAIVLTVLTHVAFVGSRMTIALYGIKLGATPFTVDNRCARNVSAYSSSLDSGSTSEVSARNTIGESAGFTF